MKKVSRVYLFVTTIVTMALCFYITGVFSHIINVGSDVGINGMVQDSEVFNETYKSLGNVIVNPIQTIVDGVMSIRTNPWVFAIINGIGLFTIIYRFVYAGVFGNYISMYLQRGGVVYDEKGTMGTARWLEERDILAYKREKTLDYESGIPLGTMEKLSDDDGFLPGKEYSTKKLVTLNDETNENKNISIVGSSGSGKTFTFFRTLVMNMLNRGKKLKESYIFTDPKGGATRSQLKRLRTRDVFM